MKRLKFDLGYSKFSVGHLATNRILALIN